jgi:hypothetical protein
MTAGLEGVEERPAWADAVRLLMTVEQVAVLWFGEIGQGGSASSNCQKIRRLIPDVLPARRIGNRWYVNRHVAEEWAAGSDPADVMAHPDTRDARARRTGGSWQ